MENFKHILYKICIVGDGAVGKTTILHQYVDNKFIEDTQMTIGTNFFIKELILEEINAKIRLQIWDLGGQPHFAAVRPSFYLGARGIIYTFDLTKIDTFNNLINWKMEIGRIINEKIPCILVGNKLDLINSENKPFNSDKIENLKEELEFSKYFETSAKDNIGIDKVFRSIAKEVYIFLQN